MDRLSEVEEKYDASSIEPMEFLQASIWMAPRGLKSYRQVDGYDAYYVRGDLFVRHRFDAELRTSTLTTKRRKSAASIVDRHEVNLPMTVEVPAEDVKAFLSQTGWQLAFIIDKSSHIFRYSSPSGVHFCTALYSTKLRLPADVGDAARWFMEVELEAHSNVPAEQGPEAVRGFVSQIRRYLPGLPAEPLNVSLFEFYLDLARGAGQREPA